MSIRSTMHGGAHNYRVLSMNIRCIRPQQIPPRTQAKLIPSDPWVRLIRPTKTLVRCCTGNGAMSVEMARPLSPLKTADLSGEDCQQRRQKLMCLPERIILSVDVHPEMGSEYSQGHSRLTLLKRMLRTFVQCKLAMNAKHQFALLRLSGRPTLVQTFTSDIKVIGAAIDALEVDGEATDLFVLDEYLHALRECAYPPGVPEPTNVLTRAILVFGRSEGVPELSDTDSLSLLQRDTFFIDVLYVHKTMEEAPLVQDIFEVLAGYLDAKNPIAPTNLFMEVSGNTQRLLYFTMLLLSHPLQRDEQEELVRKVEIGVRVSTTLLQPEGGSAQGGNQS